ncbi:MAG: hypothetical protein NC350_03050 [Corallococcus sp.]|nr:hypothetical protein [Corallococcus sp.]
MDKFNEDYGKLMDSYTELEKQFTKKCQELAEIKKETETGGTSGITPPSKQTAEEFFSAYPEAEQFREEVLRRANDPEYEGAKDAFTSAYISVLQSNRVKPEELVHDPDFLQRYVLDDAQLTSALLQKAAGASTDQNPAVISGNGGAMSVSLPTKPRTIADASRLAKEYFK